MDLGIGVGYWTKGKDEVDARAALVAEAERCGYAVAWVAEAYGSDAVTMMTWLAAATSRIDVGSAVLQIPARSAAMTGMTAASLNVLSQGRVRLGLGVSGPQVSEGWHGVRFAKPLARTREYVQIVRQVLSRQTVEFTGEQFTLPLPDGPGKPLHLMIKDDGHRVPIYLAAIGPKNVELTGEIADGWLPIFFIPEQAGPAVESLRVGRRRAGHEGADVLAGFDIAPMVPVSIDDDLERACERVRAYTALYVGGMGSATQNFYNELAVRSGFGAEAARVQELYLSGRPREAAAAVPAEFVDLTALIGPPERIAQRLGRYAEAGATTLTVLPFADDAAGTVDTVRTMADITLDGRD